MGSSNAGCRCHAPAWILAVILAAAPTANAAPAAFALPDSTSRTVPAQVFRADRLQHASLAFTLGIGSGVATRRAVVAFTVPLVLGIAKEARDRRFTRFDLTDLAADIAGAAVAALLVRHLER